MMHARLLTSFAERLPLPDGLTRLGINFLVAQTDKKLNALPTAAEAEFVAGFNGQPIALHTEAANAQHYEIPAAFFARVLGKRRKYSSGLYLSADDTLDKAEENALAETCAHAKLADGQKILELGCGWGSLSLWMAEQYPNAQIIAVSNSASQRAYIESQALLGGFANLQVVTADMNNFAPAALGFDRVVSVEMFEHMANWRALLARVHGWLAPEGRLFLHVFSHAQGPYRFDHTNDADWIAKYFFTGGLMPSHGLLRYFPDLFRLESQWRWSGVHYQRTAEHWLANYDAHAGEIAQILSAVYGAEARIWQRRWRLFFLATAGLFGYKNGGPWGVTHALLRPARG